MTDKQTLKPLITIWNGPYQTWAEACSKAKSLNIAQPMPVKFIGLGDLLKELSSIVYQQLLQCPYTSPIHSVIKPLPMENYPGKFQLHHSLSILLKKVPQ